MSRASKGRHLSLVGRIWSGVLKGVPAPSPRFTLKGHPSVWTLLCEYGPRRLGKYGGPFLSSGWSDMRRVSGSRRRTSRPVPCPVFTGDNTRYRGVKERNLRGTCRGRPTGTGVTHVASWIPVRHRRGVPLLLLVERGGSPLRDLSSHWTVHRRTLISTLMAGIVLGSSETVPILSKKSVEVSVRLEVRLLNDDRTG